MTKFCTIFSDLLSICFCFRNTGRKKTAFFFLVRDRCPFFFILHTFFSPQNFSLEQPPKKKTETKPTGLDLEAYYGHVVDIKLQAIAGYYVIPRRNIRASQRDSYKNFHYGWWGLDVLSKKIGLLHLFSKRIFSVEQPQQKGKLWGYNNDGPRFKGLLWACSWEEASSCCWLLHYP